MSAPTSPVRWRGPATEEHEQQIIDRLLARRRSPNARMSDGRPLDRDPWLSTGELGLSGKTAFLAIRNLVDYGLVESSVTSDNCGQFTMIRLAEHVA